MRWLAAPATSAVIPELKLLCKFHFQCAVFANCSNVNVVSKSVSGTWSKESMLANNQPKFLVLFA